MGEIEESHLGLHQTRCINTVMRVAMTTGVKVHSRSSILSMRRDFAVKLAGKSTQPASTVLSNVAGCASD